MEKPVVKLTNVDGNAYMILGLCQRAAKKAKMPQSEYEKFKSEAMSGDYDNLLQTVMKYFDVE